MPGPSEVHSFNVMCGGQACQVSLAISPDGSFSGSFISKTYGIGHINGEFSKGTTFDGSIALDGHNADFFAEFVPGSEQKQITGKLSAGIFFSMDFSGTAV